MMPLRNKLLSEGMLTNICDATWYHKSSMDFICFWELSYKDIIETVLIQETVSLSIKLFYNNPHTIVYLHHHITTKVLQHGL